MNPSTTRAHHLARHAFFGLLLLLAFSILGFSQKPLTVVVNPGSIAINGTTFTAKTMLAPGMLKVLGKPDRVDTLSTAQLKSLLDYSMATLNNYSGGVLLLQGKKTDRVNWMNLFINPVASKKYLDYVNTPFKGRLTLLGMKIDSNTTIRQVEKQLAKYDPYLSEEYLNLSFDVFDPNGGRLMEVKMYYLKDSEKIEYMRLKFYPAPAAKKHVIAYKGGQLFLNSIPLDTASGKIPQLKKILGEPNAVIDVSYGGLNGHNYKAKRHYYDDIAGISLYENPFNQGLLAVGMDFLSLRSKKGLSNPVFDLVINAKKFDAENAAPGGAEKVKTHYGLDSISTSVNEKDNRSWVASSTKYGMLEFEFAGKYAWEKRVYFVSYHLKTVVSAAEKNSVPKPVAAAPSLEVKQGMLILKTDKNSAYWTSSINSIAAFREAIGSSGASSGDVVDFSFGVRMWTKGGKIDIMEFYLDKFMNPYSNKNDATGIYAGTMEVEGVSLTKESTLDKVVGALTMYNFKKVYDNENHSVWKGSYKGIEIYLNFRITDKKLVAISFDQQ